SPLPPKHFYASSHGGIGRRKRLKISRALKPVPVRFRVAAPKITKRPQTRSFFVPERYCLCAFLGGLFFPRKCITQKPPHSPRAQPALVLDPRPRQACQYYLPARA